MEDFKVVLADIIEEGKLKKCKNCGATLGPKWKPTDNCPACGRDPMHKLPKRLNEL